MLIEDFFEEEYVVFANYRTTQRLPNHDGLIETQRKIIYTFLNLNKVNKERTVTLSSDVMKYTHYNHGDKSVSTVINNLAASWQNNIPLLMEDGSFGYRSNNRAADPRYTQTRIRQYLKLLFNPIDNDNFVTKQFDGDGHEIEPLTLIPVLPLLAINGQHQIGVGFASKTLPRNPEEVITLIKNILEKKTKVIPNTLIPWYWSYKGKIEAVGDNNVSWNFSGLWERSKNNTIIVREVPMKFDREKYIKSLEDLKEAGKILSYKENINKNDFYIEIKVDALTYKFTDAKIVKLLTLEAQESEFINIINDQGEIVTEFENLGQYLYSFIKWRLGVYGQRKAFLIQEIIDDIIRLNAIIRFIRLVNDNVINIHKQTKANIEAQIIANKFEKIDESYNYLLSLKIYDLTEEKIQDYLDDITKKEKEKKALEDTTPAAMWLEDISAFEKVWKKLR